MLILALFCSLGLERPLLPVDVLHFAVCECCGLRFASRGTFVSAGPSATMRGKVDRASGLRAAGRDRSALGRRLIEWQASQQRVFFFGSEARVVYALRDQVSAMFPSLTIVGICDADFAGPVSREVIAHILASKPDIVVVDMPKRDFDAFISAHRMRLEAMSVLNLPGAFPAHVRPVRAGGVWDQFVAGARFLRLVVAQAMRSVAPKSRLPRAPAVLRRDN